MRRPARRRLALWPELMTGAVFALACTAYFRFTAEDAFIVQRYASQVARGHGLVFNVGEQVSALTSPLHALLLTALTVLLPSPMVAYKIAGGVVALVAILYAARSLFDDVWDRAAFLSATLASPFVVMWSVGGLETPLLLACVTVVAVLVLRMNDRSPSASGLFTFFFLSGLAFLLRHDSVVFVLPLAAAVVARRWRQSIPGVLTATVVAGAWMLFAWLYYGDVFPTSFYEKAVVTRPPLLGGIGYQLSFVVLCIVPVSLLRCWRSRSLAAPAWVAITFFCMFGAAVGHVHMMFGYRFYVPVLPALVAWYMRVMQPSIRIRRWAFVPALAANLALTVVVYSHTVNPTIFHPSLFEPHHGFLSRLATRGLAYEYTRESASAYGDFIDALRHTGSAVRADAQVRGISRTARLATRIAGATPNEIPDVYVYDNLVGVRRNCRTLERQETYRAADYVELMVPRFGRLDGQLRGLASTAIRVSDVEFEFDGRKEHLVAYFNPSASHTPVPSKLHDPCPAGRS